MSYVVINELHNLIMNVSYHIMGNQWLYQWDYICDKRFISVSNKYIFLWKQCRIQELFENLQNKIHFTRKTWIICEQTVWTSATVSAIFVGNVCKKYKLWYRHLYMMYRFLCCLLETDVKRNVNVRVKTVFFNANF